jgi:hypothetical protein
MLGKGLVGMSFLLACGMANAGVISIGGLTLENVGDSYVTDHVNNVDYLRWDQVRDLNYGQLTAALQTGQAWDGWEIASIGEAHNFVNALLGGSSMCDTMQDVSTECGRAFPWADFETLMGPRCEYCNENGSYAWYLSDNARMEEVGLVGAVSGAIVADNEWESIALSDEFALGGDWAHAPVGFMLYREHADVPEPSTLAIFALGIMGLATRRFNKQS